MIYGYLKSSILAFTSIWIAESLITAAGILMEGAIFTALYSVVR